MYYHISLPLHLKDQDHSKFLLHSFHLLLDLTKSLFRRGPHTFFQYVASIIAISSQCNHSNIHIINSILRLHFLSNVIPQIITFYPSQKFLSYELYLLNTVFCFRMSIPLSLISTSTLVSPNFYTLLGLFS